MRASLMSLWMIVAASTLSAAPAGSSPGCGSARPPYGGVRSCSFAIEGEVDLSQADQGTVTLDGRQLAYGTEWQLSDPSTLELVGEACSTVMNGDHTVEAEFTCGSIVE